jgi:hypothetical protein
MRKTNLFTQLLMLLTVLTALALCLSGAAFAAADLVAPPPEKVNMATAIVTGASLIYNCLPKSPQAWYTRALKTLVSWVALVWRGQTR